MTEFGVDRPAAKLDFGRVFRDGFDVIRRRWAPLLVITLLLVVLPSAVVSLVRIRLFGEIFSAARVMNPYWWLPTLVGGMVGVIGQAALTHLAVRDLSQRPCSGADSFRVGLRVFLPLLLITILAMLGIGLGMVLLVVPGLMLATAWIVVLPVYVSEQVGVFEVFGRSAALTRNNRWRIFGLLLVFVVFVWLVELPLRAMLGLGAGFAMTAANVRPALTGLFIASPIYALILTPITYVGLASLYVQLRRAREGLGGEDLGEIFD